MIKVVMYISFEEDGKASKHAVENMLRDCLDSACTCVDEVTSIEIVDEQAYYCDTCKHGSGIHCPNCHEDPCVCGGHDTCRTCGQEICCCCPMCGMTPCQCPYEDECHE